jgi:hypothetical protein
MKTRHIKKLAFSGALALVAISTFISCNDANDWNVDATYDRLFHTTSFTVTSYDTKALISFKEMPNTDYYIVEYSKDSLSDNIMMGNTSTSIVDSTIVSSPDTLFNLDSSSKYYIRIKGRNKAKKESKWKYLEDYSFKTKSEQIITSVVPGSNKVTVNWTPGLKVTDAYIYKDGDSTRTVLTAENVTVGNAVLTGLTANTTYKVSLYNGSINRGSYNFKTTEAYPEGYEVINVAAGDDMMAKLKAATNSKVVVLFAQGVDYSFPTNDTGTTLDTIPINIKSVYFWGAAGDTKPSMTAKGINTASNKDTIKFYNMTLKNASSANDYIINESSKADISAIIIDKCNINTTRGIIRFQGQAEGKCQSIVINNCICTDIGSYGIFHAKAITALSMQNLTITNSTFNGLSSAAINVQQSGVNITIDHCTFYNCVPAGKAFVDVNKLTDITPTFSNVLIGMFNAYTDGTTIKGNSMKTVNASNAFYTTDCAWTSGYEIGTSIDIKSADLFKDPTNGDFTINALYSTKYRDYGDPRWKE